MWLRYALLALTGAAIAGTLISLSDAHHSYRRFFKYMKRNSKHGLRKLKTGVYYDWPKQLNVDPVHLMSFLLQHDFSHSRTLRNYKRSFLYALVRSLVLLVVSGILFHMLYSNL